MENMDRMFEKLPREIARSLEAMSKTDKLEERKVHSEIILNLSTSLGAFVEAMNTMEDSFDEDDDCFDFDELMASQKQLKKKGKKVCNDEDIPF